MRACLLLLALSLVGCTPADQQVSSRAAVPEGESAPDSGRLRDCTAIGCYSGLRVTLSAQPAGAYRVELEVPGMPGPLPRFVAECTAARCAEGLFFNSFTPNYVRIHVV